MARTLTLALSALLLCAAVPSIDTDAVMKTASDHHRRAHKTRLIKDYEAAIAGYDQVLSAQGLDAELKCRAGFYRAEAAWDLGQWQVAYDSYKLCVSAGQRYAFDSAYNRVLAAEKIKKGAVIETEETPEGERRRLRPIKCFKQGQKPPEPPFSAVRLPPSEPVRMMRAAALDFRALLVASGPNVPYKVLYDAANVEQGLMKIAAQHGMLTEAQDHRDHARELWRGYLARFPKRTSARPASTPDFDDLQRQLDAALARRTSRHP